MQPGDLPGAASASGRNFLLIHRTLLPKDSFCLLVEFVSSPPQGSVAGIKHVQTQPVNWPLSARALLWLKARLS